MYKSYKILVNQLSRQLKIHSVTNKILIYIKGILIIIRLYLIIQK